MKRFFSILLVLTMVLSLAVPVLADEQPDADAPAAEEPVVVDEAEAAAAEEPEAVDEAETVKNTAEQEWPDLWQRLWALKEIRENDGPNIWNPTLWKNFVDAYDHAKELEKSYNDDNNNVTSDMFQAAVEAAENARWNLYNNYLEDIRVALKKGIAEAQGVLADLDLTTYGENLLNNAITDATNRATWLDNLSGDTPIRDQISGWPKALTDAIADAKLCVDTVTVSLNKVEYIAGVAGTDARDNPGSIYFEVTTNGRTVGTIPNKVVINDDHAYQFQVKVNDGVAMYVQGNGADTTSTASNLANGNIAWINGRVDVTVLNRYLGNTITVGDRVTFTLGYRDGDNNFVPVSGPFNVNISNVAEKFVQDGGKFEDGSFKLNANRMFADAKLVGDAWSGDVQDSYWIVNGPNGVHTEVSARNDIVGNTNKYVTKSPASLGLSEDLAAGDYTVGLYVFVNNIREEITTWTVNVPTVNTTELKTVIASIEDVVANKDNYGPSAAVTALINAYNAAKATYIDAEKIPAATKTNTDKLAKVVANLKAAKDAVYKIDGLRAKVEEINALIVSDYTNWYAIMGGQTGPLYTAAESLAAAEGKTKFSVNAIEKDGLHEYTVAAAAPASKEAVEALVKGLADAQAKLDVKYANLLGLQTILKAVPADSTKYTKPSWAAVDTAVKAANELIASKPVASKQADVDAATEAVQAAIKALVLADGKISLVTEDGKTYIMRDGEKLTGIQRVDGKLYYASVKDSAVVKGPIWVKAKLDNGLVGRVYAKADGSLVTGKLEIGSDAYYMSAKDGHLMKAVNEKARINAGGGTYYVIDKDGHLLTGLQTVKGKTYYCSVNDFHIWRAVKGTAVVKIGGGKTVTVDTTGAVVSGPNG